MAKVRWAMVGTGLMADLILRDFPLSENTELAALVARDTSKADQKLAEVGISARSLTFEQAIADPEIDLIYIACLTPSTTGWRRLHLRRASTFWSRSPS